MPRSDDAMGLAIVDDYDADMADDEVGEMDDISPAEAMMDAFNAGDVAALEQALTRFLDERGDD